MEEFLADYLGYTICGLLVFVTLIIAIVAQVKVNSAYNKYKSVESPLGMTGAELARQLAVQEGLAVSIRGCNGHLTDHFNPADNSLNLSRDNYNGSSIAAHAIVAHEFGHAMQKEEEYLPYKFRQTTVKIANVVSKLLVPMIIFGLLFDVFLYSGVGAMIIYVYVGIYALSFFVSLATLPVEFNASKRAKVALQSLGVNDQAANGVSDVLNAAAMTYVASTLVSLAYLLRMLALLRLFTRD